MKLARWLEADFPDSERNPADKRLARAVINGEDLQTSQL